MSLYESGMAPKPPFYTEAFDVLDTAYSIGILKEPPTQETITRMASTISFLRQMPEDFRIKMSSAVARTWSKRAHDEIVEIQIHDQLETAILRSLGVPPTNPTIE